MSKRRIKLSSNSLKKKKKIGVMYTMCSNKHNHHFKLINN